MSIRHARAALFGAAIALVPLSGSVAHEIVGNRFFRATLTIDDPGVNDELALPTVLAFKTGDDPSVKQWDFSSEFSKRITETFAVSFGAAYTHSQSSRRPRRVGGAAGLKFGATFKYRVFKDPVHEFVMSVGLSIEWGRSGAQKTSARSQFNTYTPTIILRQRALATFPDTFSWLRPVADDRTDWLRDPRQTFLLHLRDRSG